MSEDGAAMLEELKEHQLWLQNWKEVCLAVQGDPESGACLGPPDIPNTEATYRIVRYEAHIVRLLNGAMNELERLQRGRQGDFVPPPVNARVDIEGQ